MAIQVNEVTKSLLTILNDMSVEKGGTLPSNMGGKSYITAVDLNAEAKRQFVKEDIVMLPSERVIRHEVVLANQRTSIAIVIEGSYTLISTKDGSQVTICGVGDGLAIGTAVAANIASTNALKNALLRTFMVTEQSVEDAAKNGVDVPVANEERKTPAQQKIEAARGTTPDSPSTATMKKWVSEGVLDEDTGEVSTLTGAQIGAVAKRILGDQFDSAGAWKRDESLSSKVKAAVAKGDRK